MCVFCTTYSDKKPGRMSVQFPSAGYTRLRMGDRISNWNKIDTALVLNRIIFFLKRRMTTVRSAV